MHPADQPRQESVAAGTPTRGFSLPSLGLVVTSAILLIAVLVADFQSPHIILVLRIALIAAILVFALLSADVIRRIRRTERQAKTAFEDTEQEFRQMADNIPGNFLGD